MSCTLCLVLGLLLSTAAVSRAQTKPPTETCLLPLLDRVAQEGIRMCDLMDEFSQCYIDTHVARDDLQSMETTLQAMVTIMGLFEQENCDLNKEFNNQCWHDFVNCLDYVTTVQGADVKLHCSESGYASFLQCVNVELTPGVGPCYFSDWHQRIVNSTRAVVCATPSTDNPQDLTEGTSKSPPTEKPTDFNDGTSEDLGPSSGYCDADGVRYHVYMQCTMYRMEWLGLGIMYEAQPVAPGTLFDVSICGLNHAHLVSC